MRSIDVLSIGNSFSQDAQRYLHQLAKHEGANIQSVNLYIGGCSLEKHFRNLKGDSREYTLEVNGNQASGFMVSIKEALLARSWDYITVQQVSRLSFREASYQPYLNELVAYIREYCPKAKILVHQTWGYADGSDMIHRLDCGYEYYEEMFADVKRCYAKAAADIGADGIIPCGEAFSAMLQNVEKIHRDAFHASLGLGRFVLALVWYKYLTGNSVSEVTFNNFDEEISEQDYKLALEVVERVVNETK